MFQFIAQLASYLVGSIPFGYLIARAKSSIDIREHGSGNIGATNVGRVLGLRYFVIVFLLDFLKGAGPVAAALWLQHGNTQPTDPRFEQYFGLPELVGFAAILGHMFPVYLGLRGGKGVATSIGVLILLVPLPTILGLFICAIFLLGARMVSVGSIAFAVTFTIGYLLIEPSPFGFQQIPPTSFVLVVGALVILRHTRNIGRILQGTEPQFHLPWQRKR